MKVLSVDKMLTQRHLFSFYGLLLLFLIFFFIYVYAFTCVGTLYAVADIDLCVLQIGLSYFNFRLISITVSITIMFSSLLLLFGIFVIFVAS